MIAGDEKLRNKVDRIEKLRDPSHVCDLSLTEMKNLYESNGLVLKTQEQTDIKVSLEAWMDLTKSSEETRKEICIMMRDDMRGAGTTGFAPYLIDDEIYFNQHWVMNIGIKQNCSNL